MTRNIVMIVTLLGFVSCHSNQSANQPVVKKDTMTMNMAAAPAPKPDLKGLRFDYKNDPACGMPLHAGLEDTAHYKGKLYGFCSKECKEAFLKDPASFVATIK